MTPTELLKWKNKLRLWRVLHPDFDYNHHCVLCQYHSTYLCEGNIRLLENIVNKEIIEFLGRRDTTSHNCVEWIRHV